MGKFVLKQASNGEYMFNLHAGNGQVILTSQLYSTKDAAMGGIESVRANAAEEDNFEVKTSSSEKAYFVLKAGNGKEVGRSELYESGAACQNGVRSVMANAADASVESI